MKLFIASDIHGSAFYCRQMVEAYSREKADKLLLLGDILYHGPRNDFPKELAPKLVIEMLNALNKEIICVRGNCDSEVDQMVLDFPIMADYSLLEINGLLLFATHGHLFNPSCPPTINGDYVLLNGHTHYATYEEHSNYWYINPGSISLPKAGTEHGYVVLDDKTFLWKTLEGNTYNSITL